MNVKRGKPRVLGPDPTASGLLLIDVQLEPRPDAHWAAIFGGTGSAGGVLSGPPGLSFTVPMHPPSLQGAKVVLRAPDAEIERYLASLDERIELTNAEYERRIAPALERQRQEAERALEEERRRVEKAQRRLDELS